MVRICRHVSCASRARQVALPCAPCSPVHPAPLCTAFRAHLCLAVEQLCALGRKEQQHHIFCIVHPLLTCAPLLSSSAHTVAKNAAARPAAPVWAPPPRPRSGTRRAERAPAYRDAGETVDALQKRMHKATLIKRSRNILRLKSACTRQRSEPDSFTVHTSCCNRELDHKCHQNCDSCTIP